MNAQAQEKQLKSNRKSTDYANCVSPNYLYRFVIGVVLPIALFLILTVIDGILINVAYSRFNAAIGLNKQPVFALLVPLEIISLFFLARFNKTMVVAALISATEVTLLLLNFILNLSEIPPS